MVDFTVPCSTFRRIAIAALQHDETDSRDFIRCVRIEAKNDHMVVIATCGKILVAERIKGECGNGVVHVAVDPVFLAFVERGVSSDDVLIISQAPGWTVARLASGPMHMPNAEHPGADQWPAWRELIPSDLPNKTQTAVAFNGSEIERMAKTAPSGEFVLPKYIDANRPIIVRDIGDPEWFGMFLAQDHNNKPFDPAKIPDWVR